MTECVSWGPYELLPKIELMAEILGRHRGVTGVAVTGSVARFEKRVHDIDLVVFHDGTLPDGSSIDPEDMAGKSAYEGAFTISGVFSGYLWRLLSTARGSVPANIILVHEKVLWDCAYLKQLQDREKKFNGFYQAVFCQLPLILLSVARRGENLAYYVDGDGSYSSAHQLKTELLARTGGLDYRGVYISHRCGNPECRPKQSWEERQKIILARKGHSH